MYEQVEKSKEKKSRTVANSVGQKKKNVKQGFGFVDNRPEAIAQRKLAEQLRAHDRDGTPPPREKEKVSNSKRFSKET